MQLGDLVLKNNIEKNSELESKMNIIPILSYYFLISIILLIFSTKSSPLYPFNNWVDSNAFFTMGKGMMNGKVLYRDLFEQKGPLLYFIHGLSYLISKTTFLGVFIFEVISFFIFLVYCHKITIVFIDVRYSIFSNSLIASIIISLPNFSHGDSAEEFSLPLLAITLYYMIIYFKKIYPRPISYKWLLINGTIAGSILWIKYSLLGFWVGFVFIMGICMIVEKQYLRIVLGSLTFLCGMLIVTIPWIIYFGINNSIQDWISTYILSNARYYTIDLTLLGRIKFVVHSLYNNLRQSLFFSIVSFTGMILFFFTNIYVKNTLTKVGIISSFVFLTVGVYGGGRGYSYYFLIISPFVIFGLITIVDLLSRKLDKKISSGILIASLLFSSFITIFFNHNTYMLKLKKEDLVQYQFASIIKQKENATLLNYGVLDAGFYTVTGITPNVRFFMNQNIPYSKLPLIMDEQNRYIKEQLIDFVVVIDTLETLETNVPNFYTYYELISEGSQVFGTNEKYWLFKSKQIH